MHKEYRIRGAADGDRINYVGPTKANTAALSTVKSLLQSVVSNNADDVGHEGLLPYDASTASGVYPHPTEVPCA